MSIYGTWLQIEDERQTRARLQAIGINYGIISDDGEVDDFSELPEEMLDAPIVYQGSHVLPQLSDKRGGGVEVGAIPAFITRDGYKEDATVLNDFLRLGVHSEDSDGQYEGKPYIQGGDATVVLHRAQVERLRDTLTNWLEREPEIG